MSEPLNELIVIPKETALEVFTKPGGLEPYLEQIKAAVTGIVPDLSTKKGRDAVASLAYKVAKSKTYLDGEGKRLVDEFKEIPKKIDASRKQAREFLDQLKDEVRKPLTEWEAEQARIQSVINTMEGARNLNPDRTSTEVEQAIAYLEARDLQAENLGDRLAEAEGARLASLEALRELHAQRKKFEDDQAELARLRAEKEERDRQDRERQIAEQAAEQARQQEQQRQQAEREAAERQVREAEEAAQRAEQERLQAEERAAQAERDAQARAEQAAEAERQRIAEEQRQQEEEARAREADREHRKAINTTALNAFIEGGMDAESAKLAVTLIAQRKIPAISIAY